jgi:type VI secretion system secreted protein Hcp
VKTENSQKGHTNETLIESFSWGVSNPVTTSGGRTISNVSNSSSVNLTKKRDIISAQLQKAAFTGRSFAKAEIRFYKTEGAGKDPYVYLTVFLEQVKVESYQLSAAGTERPNESVSFNFTKISFEDAYYEGNKIIKRPVEGWDIQKNEAIKQ